jgi:hypothetical protein
MREYIAEKDRDAFNALCAIRSEMILAALDLAASRSAPEITDEMIRAACKACWEGEHFQRRAAMTAALKAAFAAAPERTP